MLNHKLQIAVKDALNYGVLAKAPTLGSVSRVSEVWRKPLLLQVEIPLDRFERDKPIVNQWIALGHTS